FRRRRNPTSCPSKQIRRALPPVAPTVAPANKRQSNPTRSPLSLLPCSGSRRLTGLGLPRCCSDSNRREKRVRLPRRTPTDSPGEGRTDNVWEGPLRRQDRHQRQRERRDGQTNTWSVWGAGRSRDLPRFPIVLPVRGAPESSTLQAIWTTSTV